MTTIIVTAFLSTPRWSTTTVWRWPAWGWWGPPSTRQPATPGIGPTGRWAGRPTFADAFATLGFADPVFYHYDIDVGAGRGLCGPQPGPEDHPLNGQRATIVAVILRGGGYGGEWVSNLHTGVGAGHAGFVIPVNEVMTALRNYLARAGAQPRRDGHRQALGGRLQPGRGRRQPAGGADQQRTARDRPQKRLRLHVRHAGGP